MCSSDTDTLAFTGHGRVSSSVTTMRKSTLFCLLLVIASVGLTALTYFYKGTHTYHRCLSQFYDDKLNKTALKGQVTDRHKGARSGNLGRTLSIPTWIRLGPQGPGVSSQQTPGPIQQPHTDCPDVLGLMLKGEWKPRPLTDLEDLERRTYFMKARMHRKLPLLFQRADSHCGNVSFPPPHQYWRALCDPHGPTPCCSPGHVCLMHNIAECARIGGEDMRTVIHAEYATWLPADARCQPIHMSREEACALLDGYTLAFFGDSLVRQFYTAFLILMRGDETNGALIREASEDMKTLCQAHDMFFTKAHCVDRLLDTDAKLCNGALRARYFDHFISRPDFHQRLLSEMKEIQIQGKNKTMALLGFGLHFALNATSVTNSVLRPLFRILSSTQNQGQGHHVHPKLLWAAVHAPNLLNSPSSAPRETFLRFNKEMKEFLTSRHVPIFDTYNMTSQRLMASNALHYGLGVNRMKAIVFLNYLLELRAKRQW